MRLYTPKYLGDFSQNEQFGYITEYQHLIPLNEKWVFGNISKKNWYRIIDAIFKMLEEYSEVQGYRAGPSKKSLTYFLKERAINRVKEFTISNEIDLETSLELNKKKIGTLSTILETLFTIIGEGESLKTGFWHGDLCFSNIFFDENKNLPITIDPRGRNIQY